MSDTAPEGMPVVLLASKLLGRNVCGPDGAVVGRLRDLVVSLRAAHPSVTGLVVGANRGSTRLLPWSAVGRIDPKGPVRLRDAAGATTPQVPERELPLAPHELLLHRDVVDTQVVDLQDFRLSRVSDLYLACQPDGMVEVAAAEVGFAAVLRRMGLGWWGRPLRPVVVDWTDLHLTSRRGHELQLGSASAAFHSLDSHGMAELLTRVSTDHATELIRSLPPGHAAAAIHGSHPTTGRRLIRALTPDHASLLVAAADPAHAPGLVELQVESAAPGRRRLLRTAGWRRYRPSHRPLGRRDRRAGR